MKIRNRKFESGHSETDSVADPGSASHINAMRIRIHITTYSPHPQHYLYETEANMFVPTFLRNSSEYVRSYLPTKLKRICLFLSTCHLSFSNARCRVSSWSEYVCPFLPTKLKRIYSSLSTCLLSFSRACCRVSNCSCFCAVAVVEFSSLFSSSSTFT